MEAYITNFSTAEYFGCDGAPPQGGPWKKWIDGDDPLIGEDFAEFLWSHFCEALWLFLQIDVQTRGGAPHSAASFERAINACLELAESRLDAPLSLDNPFYFDSAINDATDTSSHAQVLMLLAYCVWCIDRMIEALRDGDARQATFATASAFRGLQLVHEYHDEFPQVKRRAESKRQSEIAKQRHAESDKRRDLKRVKDCWIEWQRTPSNYRSKAAFARDMLSKYENLESTKYIEDMCRQWEKEKAKSTGRLRIVPAN